MDIQRPTIWRPSCRDCLSIGREMAVFQGLWIHQTTLP